MYYGTDLQVALAGKQRLTQQAVWLKNKRGGGYDTGHDVLVKL